jgi:hypothetical protein
VAEAIDRRRMSLDDQELVAAAHAAGYRSRRLGVALFVLEFLAAAHGNEDVAATRLGEALDGCAKEARRG